MSTIFRPTSPALSIYKRLIFQRSFSNRRLVSTKPVRIFEDEDAATIDTSEPVILKQAFKHLPAIAKWFTPSVTKKNAFEVKADYLERYADIIVPLEITRLDPLPSSGSPGPTPKTVSFDRINAPLSLLLTHMMSQEPTKSDLRIYLAQHTLTDLPSPLQSDLPTPTPLLERLGRADVYASSLWMGKPPTVTPLHRDPNPNLFVQLVGEKRIRLMEPGHGRAVYERARAGGRANLRGEEMMVGEEREILEQEIWGDGRGDETGKHRGVECVEASLVSGDALYIPLGWWHAVRGSGEGVNASANWWFR